MGLNETIGSAEDQVLSFLCIAICIVFVALFSLIFFYLLIGSFKTFFKKSRSISIDKNVKTKAPNLSAVLSLAFPGLGQIYNREIYRGFIYIILTFLMCSVIFFTFALLKVKSQIIQFSIAAPFILFLIFVYFNGIIDAYRTAFIVNQKIIRTKRKNKKDLATMMELGRALYRNKNYEAAIDTYTDIISLNPKHKKAYYNRGVIHYKLNNYLAAGNDFISAAKLDHKKAQKILKSEGIEYLKY